MYTWREKNSGEREFGQSLAFCTSLGRIQDRTVHTIDQKDFTAWLFTPLCFHFHQ